jgi:hypothetical protein
LAALDVLLHQTGVAAFTRDGHRRSRDIIRLKLELQVTTEEADPQGARMPICFFDTRLA